MQQKRFFVLKIVLNDGTGLPGTQNVQLKVMDSFFIPAATKIGFKSAFSSRFTDGGTYILAKKLQNLEGLRGK
jgi:hypothetical protein